jgi:hypothetical protein
MGKLLSLRTHRKDQNQEENVEKNDLRQTLLTTLRKEDVLVTEVKIVRNQSTENQEKETIQILKIHWKNNNYQNSKTKNQLNKSNQLESSKHLKIHLKYFLQKKIPQRLSHHLRLGKELLILINRVLKVNRVSLSLLQRKVKQRLKISGKDGCGVRIAAEI